MSTINVTNLSGRGGATPNLPDGANITGVATATSFDGSLKSTGTPTLGLGVTINASGLAISGVATAGIISATTLYGDGSNLTGVGESIAPWYYNPDVNDQLVTINTGIGITFNKKINMGSSGTATLKMVNAGVAGTTIQSWGISSATQSAVTEITLGSLVSDLVINKTYQLDIPEGFVVSSTGTSYAGTAYTFATQAAQSKLWSWGYNHKGQLGQNNTTQYSSPIQVPGSWNSAKGTIGQGMIQNIFHRFVIKEDGTLWSWGLGSTGKLGQNATGNLSSPVQVGSDTTWKTVSASYGGGIATKTDGTLWVWGNNQYGDLGQNNRTNESSPKQIPGTTWSHAQGGYNFNSGLKTDGTLWAWGENGVGQLGLNDVVKYSSPVQIPGTTWTNKFHSMGSNMAAIKSDGTGWMWGSNSSGKLGQNSGANAHRSSPVQLPGTNWNTIEGTGQSDNAVALKTDGTAWAWGNGTHGALGVNNRTVYSSPVQIGSDTTWSQIRAGNYSSGGLKTDGTGWVWGDGSYGKLAQNSQVQYSSPVQVPGTEWANMVSFGHGWSFVQNDQTP